MIQNERGNEALGVIVVVGFFLFLVGFCMWLLPTYSVWQQGLSGQAALAKATQDRQIKIQEALASSEAAKHLKDAEITRAQGHAAAISIVGETLKTHPNYVNYMWVNAVGERDNQTIIYVPTEANLPILEAGRIKK